MASLVLVQRRSARRSQSFGFSLDLMVAVAVVLATLPTAQTELSLEEMHDEGDEVSALIQTAAEGKIRSPVVPELEVKAPNKPMNFCLTDLADGDVDASKHNADDIMSAKVVIGACSSPEAPESLESRRPAGVLFAAAALGTLIARSILMMQSATAESESQCHSMQVKLAAAAPSGASLLEAVRAKDAERVAKLLKLGATANTADSWGTTPLHVAASVGDAKVTQLLLDSRADVDAIEAWEETPLHMAARSGSTEVCELLLAKGAAVNSINSSDQTPLLVAGLAGQRSACEALLDHGAGVGDIGEDDLPPLLVSLIAGRCLAACLGERKH
mmetsp:Transcript_14494/g.36704  ORF Transcript_14494/g.36704 Transcript_14494/m.36704 type:complete len:330 (-) Transcript_14494:268-1257(-)